ncbi:Nucleotide-binding universal stress protein, UspA family [Microbulbifer donghaiensis]|uniref:Nucleotide-binding universal stress protein, UspA family n=1 Tax=Microbulbifer donghaiensis TaxID=494016 RepID=A0A1M4UNI2_9GAMM|nr:universal stress protein [Microbulbifer donghaiensis]SHE58143.1 Nucleotide-binding universal stress protein, UspA family [Microbulbifer donghaiensis]
MLFKQILLPLDGSSVAEEAIGHAVLVARNCGAAIHLLHVQRTAAHSDEHSIDPVHWRLRRAELQSYLNRLAEFISDKEISVTVSVREGRPAEQIVEYCEEAEIDLIVFTAYGKGGISRFHFGSTAQKVFSGAGRSFMIVRPGVTAPSQDQLAYGRILISVDGSPHSEWMACQVAAMMRGQPVELILLQVIAVPEMPRRMPITREEHATREKFVENNRRAAQSYLDEMAQQLENGIKVSFRLVIAENMADSICATAAEEAVDLIAMSAHDWQSGGQRVMGNICQTVMCHSPIPVLVLQDRPEIRQSGEAEDEGFCRIRQEFYSENGAG